MQRPGHRTRLIPPIFIVGTGRCGSTVFHEMFTQHPQVAYLSGLLLRFPQLPALNRRAMHLIDAPIVGGFARRRFRPAEHWPFWEAHCRGFSVPFRDLFAGDVRPPVKAHLTRVFGELTTARRARLVVKLSGWPRIGFLSEIFPDARFIHIMRDGRAVANSLLNADFWLGHRGPRHWQWGDLPSALEREWVGSGRSFVTLAGIQWKLLMDAFEKARGLVPPSHYLELRYDGLVRDPKGAFARVLDFCELPFTPEFGTVLDSFELESANFKWRQQLTPFQQAQLEASLAGHLERWGFSAPMHNAPEAPAAQHRISTGLRRTAGEAS